MAKCDNEHVCCICGKTFNGYGNNPEPVKPYKAGECCDECNMNVVIPSRLKAINDQMCNIQP